MSRYLFATATLLSAALANVGTTARAADVSAGGLEEIVVTAARREESAQKAAFAIQAISSEELERAGVTRPEDLNAIAPGVSIATAGNYPQIYLRGIGSFSADTYAESAVATNVDGFYISRPWASRGMFFDLDRVEVLKGPQGTLYGRNASGGALNLITARPSLTEANGYVEAETGNYSHTRIAAAVNVPFSNTVAMRLAGQVNRRDGYLSDGYDDESSEAGRVHLLWQPDSDLSLLLSGSYQHTGGKGAGAVLNPQLPGDKWRGNSDPAVVAALRADPILGALTVVPDNAGRIDLRSYSVSAELNWHTTAGTLTVLPGYLDAHLADLHYVPGFRVTEYQHDKQSSIETRFTHEGSLLRYVAGLYYFDEKQGDYGGHRYLDVEQGVNAQIVGPYDSETKSYAGFGQATFNVTDAFRLTAGLRYTHENKTQGGLTYGYSFPNQTPPPVCGGVGQFDLNTPSPPLFCVTTVTLANDINFSSWTYKAGMEFDVAPESLLYLGVSTGFKSGGFYAAPEPNTYKPEKLTAFDFGWKNRLWDNRLQLNAEAFYWKFKDHQEAHLGPSSVPGFFVFLTENAGRATLYGAALDIAFLATPQDRINLKTQYEHTEYNEFEYTHTTAVFGPPATGCAVGPLTAAGTQTVDCSGQPVVRAPEWTGSAGYEHTFDLSNSGHIVASADAQYASSSYLSIDFLPQAKQGWYTVYNFDLHYAAPQDKWRIGAYVHNVTNEAVMTQAFHYPFSTPANPELPNGAFFATLRAPRTYGVDLRVNF